MTKNNLSSFGAFLLCIISLKLLGVEHYFIWGIVAFIAFFG